MAAFRKRWAEAAGDLKSRALAVSTQKSYASYRRSYMKFCQLAGYKAVPVDSQQICEYIAYLAARLSYASIRKYLSVIRILHVEVGLKDPQVSEMYDVKLVLLALRKLLGDNVSRKEAIDPVLLGKMHASLDLDDVNNKVFWAICLLGFFGLLRISNMLGVPCESFDSFKFLTRKDFAHCEFGLVLKLYWAKNNQFQSRVVEVPIPRMVGHVLCPVTAILDAFHATSEVDKSGPAFCRKSTGNKLVPVAYGWFRSKLLSVIEQCGVDHSKYGTHSLRRGGASWALRCGMSSEVIRILGDWHSDAYRCYLEVPFRYKIEHMRVFAKYIKKG